VLARSTRGNTLNDCVDTPLSFPQQVQIRLASGERRGSLIEHATTPAVLRMLGLPAAPLTMAPSILLKIATGKQGDRPPLTQKQIERIPELLDDPVAIYIQPGEVSWTVLSSEWDSKGNPIVICVRPYCRDGVRRINAITTAFGKDYAHEWVLKQAKALRYRGQKANPRLPLPGPIYNQAGALKTEGSDVILLGPEDLRKYRESSRAKTLSI